MYETLQKSRQMLEGLKNTPLTQETSSKLCEVFAVTANNVDKMAGFSESVEDSRALAKIHQGMLACERLIKNLRESAQQENMVQSH